jgi:hypothetical protein
MPIVVSVGGASDREIHSVVQEEADHYGYPLGPLNIVRGFDVGAADPFRVLIEYGNNWVRMNSFPIAIQGPLSAAALIGSIERLLISGPMRERERNPVYLYYLLVKVPEQY